MAYRPWGLLDWALQLTTTRQWSFIGALSTEERGLAAWHWLSEMGVLLRYRLLEIVDTPSRHTLRARELLREREQKFCDAGGRIEHITRSIELLTELHRIVAFAREIETASTGNGSVPGSVILDITSLPKRFFFPLLRHFEQSKSFRDLVVTYTSPERYLEGDALSEDATDWLTLPGFHGKDGQSEMLIVSVGFMAESLQNHLATIKKQEAVKMLIPFPAPLNVLRRTWESVFRLESERPPDKFEHHRVDAADLPDAFDRIVSLSREKSAIPAFAPFGPKPISAAMCLFASQRQCPVYYPQPRIYRPDYSQGVGEADGKRAVFAYWIKHKGESLYRI